MSLVSCGDISCIRETRSADNTRWPFDKKNPKYCTSCLQHCSFNNEAVCPQQAKCCNSISEAFSHSSCVSAGSNRSSTHWIRVQLDGGAKLANVALTTAEHAAELSIKCKLPPFKGESKDWPSVWMINAEKYWREIYNSKKCILCRNSSEDGWNIRHHGR